MPVAFGFQASRLVAILEASDCQRCAKLSQRTLSLEIDRGLRLCEALGCHEAIRFNSVRHHQRLAKP